MDYMTLKEASEKWGVTPRRINYYCAAGRIPGAIKMATIWLIPKDADKLLAPGENRHFEPGENSQFQPGRNRQSVPGGCSQPRFGCRF